MATAVFDPYGNLLEENTARRLLKAFSPLYLARKLSLLAYERAHPDHPWLARGAICRLEKYLRSDHVGFEWGSGRGSLWFARRCAQLTSVEHNPAWAEVVRGMIAHEGIINVDHRLVEERDYLSVIDVVPADSLDFVLVDGLHREHALLASIPRVKPGGWLIFDNVNWYFPSNSRTPHSRSLRLGAKNALFAQAAEQLSSWERHWESNGVNDTAIYIRPKH